MTNINSIQDDNQVYSMLASTGTAGTATAIRVVADANGNLGIAGTVVSSVAIGTVPEITNLVGGTITRVQGGSIVVTTGTIAAMNSIGTVGVVNDGTVAIRGTVPVSGALTIGTISEITNIAGGTIVTTMGDISGGTIDLLTAGTISMINAGTITSVGTIPGVGVIGNLNAGSVVVTNGTVASVGTIPGIGIIGNINSGTLAAVTSVTNVANGTLATVTSIGNLVGGTIGIITAGTITPSTTIRTISAGTITVGNGTIASVGTVPGVGVVASVTNLAAGTISAGFITPSPSATGGGTCSIFRNTGVGNTAVSVKAGAGRIYKSHIVNTNTSDYYLHIYDVVGTSVQVGTTAPNFTYWVPAIGGIDDSPTIPITLGTQISVAVTGGLTGTATPTTPLLVEFLYI